MRTMRRLLMTLTLLTLTAGMVFAGPRADNPADPLHRADAKPAFADGPAPFPDPPRTIIVNSDTPGGLVSVSAPAVSPVTFDHALVGVYLRQMTAASRRSDGTLKLIVGCPDMARSDDRALANTLMALPLPNAFLGAITGFQRWYREVEHVDMPGVSIAPIEWTNEELSTVWKSYAAHWLNEHRVEVESLRPFVADAVLEAGLRRASDLLITPATYENLNRVSDCITCAPPLVCSCQTYADGDCSGAASSCTVTELPPLTKARSF